MRRANGGYNGGAYYSECWTLHIASVQHHRLRLNSLIVVEEKIVAVQGGFVAGDAAHIHAFSHATGK